jgi:hypothetical protein
MKGTKKLLVVFAFVAGISAAPSFALGFGLQTGFPFGSWDLVLKTDKYPAIFSAGMHGKTVNLAADWWFANPTIVSDGGFNLNWFWGLGVGGYINTNSDSAYHNFGAMGRLILGLNTYIGKYFEIYLDGIGHLGISAGDEGINIPDPGLGANLGFRFWSSGGPVSPAPKKR